MEKVERFLSSRLYTALLIATALAAVALDLQSFAIVFYVAVACLILLLPSSTSRIIPLFTVVCAMAHTCYGKSEEFSSVFILAVPLAAAIVFNIIYYKKKIAKGGFTCPALIAVAFAVLIGGLGINDMSEYVKDQNLYYYLGLSVGLVAAYFVSRILWHGEDPKAVRASVLEGLYAGGITCALIILLYYVMDIREFIDTLTVLKPFTINPGRNSIAALMIPGIAAAFYYAQKNIAHFSVIAVMYLSAVLSASRSNMLFSAAVILLGIIYLAYYDKAHRKAYVTILSIIGASFIVIFPFVLQLLSTRLESGGFFSSDMRLVLYRQGLEDFVDYPAHGTGIIYGGNSRYDQTAFSYELVWYHNAIVQILGSFGLIGAAAYGTQLCCRIKAVLLSKSHECMILGLAYVGLIMLSMTEPGIFAPVPTALLLTVIFACVDGTIDENKELEKQTRKEARLTKKQKKRSR